MQQEPAQLRRADGPTLAYFASPGRRPGLVFLPGFMSDMSGVKAMTLARFCADRGQAFVRFDYRGHGRSDGVFAESCISEWLADTLSVVDRLTEGPQILVGSSMGGWLALLAGLARPDRVAGIVGLAAAPDFTEELIWQAMSPAEQRKLMAEGVLHEPSPYGAVPYCFSRKLIEDGRRHLLLGRDIALSCPVRLMHGMADTDVPFATALRIAEKLTAKDVVVSLIKDGEHRLSRDQDLDRLCQMVAELTGRIADLMALDEAAPVDPRGSRENAG